MKSLPERVAGLKLGDTLLVAPANAERARMAAYHRGFKMHIVHRNVGGLVLMQRVAETKWGRNKARVAALEVGDSINVPFLEYNSLSASALRIAIYLSRKIETDGTVTLTRVPIGKKIRCARMLLREWKPGDSINVPLNRALSLIASAPRYGLRLSRKQAPAGEYILTRVA